MFSLLGSPRHIADGGEMREELFGRGSISTRFFLLSAINCFPRLALPTYNIKYKIERKLFLSYKLVEWLYNNNRILMIDVYI